MRPDFLLALAVHRCTDDFPNQIEHGPQSLRRSDPVHFVKTVLLEENGVY